MNFGQFAVRTKVRHDWGDQIQVRLIHPNGENYDTWVSGEEVLARLKTASREKLIKNFSRLNWGQAKDAASQEIDKGKDKLQKRFRDKLADSLQDNIGGNLFGDTLADNIRGVDSNVHPYDHEKQQWQERLRDPAFRMIVLDIAWFDLEGSFPDFENQPNEPDDWM